MNGNLFSLRQQKFRMWSIPSSVRSAAEVIKEPLLKVENKLDVCDTQNLYANP